MHPLSTDTKHAFNHKTGDSRCVVIPIKFLRSLLSGPLAPRSIVSEERKDFDSVRLRGVHYPWMTSPWAQVVRAGYQGRSGLWTTDYETHQCSGPLCASSLMDIDVVKEPSSKMIEYVTWLMIN